MIILASSFSRRATVRTISGIEGRSLAAINSSFNLITLSVFILSDLMWKFVFVDQEGLVFVSKEFHLNAEHYVKDGFDEIYRLVYYVVKQSHISSPRTTPIGSVTNLNH